MSDLEKIYFNVFVGSSIAANSNIDELVNNVSHNLEDRDNFLTLVNELTSQVPVEDFETVCKQENADQLSATVTLIDDAGETVITIYQIGSVDLIHPKILTYSSFHNDATFDNSIEEAAYWLKCMLS